MNDWTLAIFPENASAVVVTTCVWVGVWVVALLNLRFGWTLSGLVVPGYLVPLLLIHPESVWVIFIESVLTYAIVHSLSENFGSMRYWCSLFGRDRFFALVVVSVLVRVLCDGWCWPWLAAQADATLDTHYDLSNRLHSYGLIVVPLIANYFWKPGLIHGGMTLGVQVAATFVLVRYGLAEFTNFHLGSLQYLYDDISSSLLASPKSYIILLTTAWLASWMNLRYAWDFSGILIPALFALQWHTPGKIAFSIVEALVVYVSATCLVRLPWFRRVTVEGARKLLVFFNLAFAYRMILAWVIPALFPGANVGDYRGYGYLLTTLLAIRFYQSNNVLKILTGTLQVSLVGAVGSSVLGFLLTYSPLPSADASPMRSKHFRDAQPFNSQHDIVEALRIDKMSLYHDKLLPGWTPPSRFQRDSFAGAIHRLRTSAARDPSDASVATARQILAQLGFELHHVPSSFYYIRAQAGQPGRGLYVIHTEAEQGPVVQVPSPLDDLYAFEAGVNLFMNLPARGLAIAPAVELARNTHQPRVLGGDDSYYATFIQALEASRSLQVRCREGEADGVEVSRLWVRSGVPQGLDLRRLEQLLGKLTIEWSSSSARNALRDATRTGFGELEIPPATCMRLLVGLVVPENQNTTELRQITEPLHAWLQQRMESLAKVGSNAYVPPRLEELLFLDREVVEPLVRIVRRLPTQEPPSAVVLHNLELISRLAGRVGYELSWSTDVDTGENFVVLYERTPLRRYWGTVVFRCGAVSQTVWETPRPSYERFAWEFCVSEFLRNRGDALLLAGAHPKANDDGTADLVRPLNKISLFNLVHEVLMRESGADGLLIVQCRSIRNPVDSDVVMSVDDGSSLAGQLSPRVSQLWHSLTGMDWSLALADGSVDFAGYELGSVPQRASLALSPQSEFVSLWISPSLRGLYRSHAEGWLRDALQHELDVPVQEVPLIHYLSQLSRRGRADVEHVPWHDDLLHFQATRDVVVLRRLQMGLAPNALTAIVDPVSEQIYLLVDDQPGCYPAIVLLTGRPSKAWQPMVMAGWDAARVQEFIAARYPVLEIRGTP